MKKNILFPVLAALTVSALPTIAAGDYSHSQVADETATYVPASDLSAAAENFLGNKRLAWRGERVLVRVRTQLPANAKLSASLVGKKTIPARAEYVRSTIGQNGKASADIVEPAGTAFKIPAGDALILVSADIPADFAQGPCKLELKINGKSQTVAEIEVINAVLPPPADWKIHLDFWQHPEAVARWAGVKLWSREHFAALKPVMQRLADAGQKVITCSIIEEPWDHQTYDHWTSMVKWSKTRSGKWKFDYSAFDKYVEFMMKEIGIDEQISCYTMVSWSLKTTYFDEADQKTKTISLDPKSPDYDATWKAFLSDFRKHLRQKGWLGKTCIALDERPDALVNAARTVVEKYAPELKIVSAVDRPTKMSPFVFDISAAYQHADGVAELADSRRAEKRKTTFYICLHPAKPNTFPHSGAAEPHWLLYFAAANRFDGILRWAYNSWVKNPFADARWEKRPAWPAGDCFLVYPGNRTTLRFETVRDGIEDFEKIHLLKAAAEKPNAKPALKKAVADLESSLRTIYTVKTGYGNAHAEQVRTTREKIDAASRLLGK